MNAGKFPTRLRAKTGIALAKSVSRTYRSARVWLAIVAFACRAGLILVAVALPVLPLALAAGEPLPGQIVVKPGNPAWLVRHGGQPYFLAGPGDPEDFLYRGIRLADGTRSGDQETLIEKLKGTGANSIYLQAVRSHGGDGDPTHNPFVDNDPEKGINLEVLAQWEQWFQRMDQHGITIFFFFYDDSADVWGRNPDRQRKRNIFEKAYDRLLRHWFESVGSTEPGVGLREQHFLKTIVEYFGHHENLIWVIAEEYEEVFTARQVSEIAKLVRHYDRHDHVIAVHKLPGLEFDEFADDPNIDQFAIQYNAETARDLHAGMIEAWHRAAGKFNLNMSEVAYGGIGKGSEARKKAWAIAMGGAYVMINGMDIATTAESDLIDLGRLSRFMTTSGIDTMVPSDHMADGATEYVLASPAGNYIAYSSLNGASQIGLRGIRSGQYQLRWLDIASGQTREQTTTVTDGAKVSWNIPPGFGSEIAVHVKGLNRQD